MLRSTRLSIGLLTICLLPTGTAGADQTLSQTPDSVSMFFSDTDVTYLGGSSNAYVDNFTVTTANPFVIDEVVIWGGFWDGTFAAQNRFTVTFHTNQIVGPSELPGSIISQQLALPAVSAPTGNSVQIFPGKVINEIQQTITLQNSVSLAAGTYWVEIYMDTTPDADDWLWSTAATDPVHGLPNSSWTSSPGSNFNFNPNRDFAVVLNGKEFGVWTDLGNSLPGAGGAPQLSGTGDLIGGNSVGMTLSNALPNSTAYLILGVSAANLPFFGGTLIPTPTIVAPLPSGPSGTLTFQAVVPSGLPAGIPIYAQFWVADPSALQGVSSSNGITSTTL